MILSPAYQQRVHNCRFGRCHSPTRYRQAGASAGAAAPPRPAQAFMAQVALATVGGWLVGDPRSYLPAPRRGSMSACVPRGRACTSLSGSMVQAPPFAALA